MSLHNVTPPVVAPKSEVFKVVRVDVSPHGVTPVVAPRLKVV